MSKFCPNCGASLAEGAKFCNGCGAQISEEAPQPYMSPPQQAQPQYQQFQQYQPPNPRVIKVESHRSSFGMEANMAALFLFLLMAAVLWIPYLGWAAWGVPLIFFIKEKTSKFVRFQAVTALIIGIVQASISLLLQIIVWIVTPGTYSGYNYIFSGVWGAWAVLSLISTVVSVAVTGLLAYLIYAAYYYKQAGLPLIGNFAWRASENLNDIGSGQNK